MNLVYAATAAITVILGIQNANAQEARTLPEGAFAKPATTWFDPKTCKQNAGADLYLSVGKATLKVPAAIVNGASFGKLDGTVTHDPAGQITMKVPFNLGCPEKPFSVSLVRLDPVQGVDAGVIQLSWSPDNREALELQLAKLRDEGSCPDLEPGLLFCNRGLTEGSGAREQTIYLIASDSKSLQKSGGPLRARCLIRNDRPFCNVIDDVDGDVRYELPIIGMPSLAAITQAHTKARAYIDSLRVKPR